MLRKVEHSGGHGDHVISSDIDMRLDVLVARQRLPLRRIGTAQRGQHLLRCAAARPHESSPGNHGEDDGQRALATESPRPYCEPGQFDASAKPADRQQLQHFASPNFGNFLAPRT